MTTSERSEERTQTNALRGRIIEIQHELRECENWTIRKALQHERAMICEELSRRERAAEDKE